MGKRKNRKKFKKDFSEKLSRFSLPEEVAQKILGVLLISASIIIVLSFFKKAGIIGEIFLKNSEILIGKTVFLIPIFLFIGGLILIRLKYVFDEFRKDEKAIGLIVLAILICVIGITGILGSFNPEMKMGGIIGHLLGSFILKYFGFWATQIIFITLLVIGFLIFWHFVNPIGEKEEVLEEEKEEKREEKPSIIRKIFAPKFKVKEISSSTILPELKNIDNQPELPKIETKAITTFKNSSYQPPPLELLEAEKGTPTSGDTKVNSAIIKKTLQNFGIEVVMSEVNIGPTVTQYTLKPAEGIKLSKITSLSNDLSLALASHPIRIEAPIPGRSLVGIEVPNKVRAQVRLRNLIEDYRFQKSSGILSLVLGRDVSGTPFYADLTKMPHMLVAGSTGSGKTIFLNTIILSLLYQPNNSIKNGSPEFLRFILIDPKRVEFPIYEGLPHLLCPVIYNASQTVNALRWLTSEMERRFDVLAEAKTRDISSFNEFAYKNKIDPLPFIVVIIDELADLMAAKGREIEAAIVRLAQMARAVGIHLIVATQRPSVEVITGLIKANITARVTFQVASQVDSRTILDMAGAERLLGAGDMLYISGEVAKPKRIQAPYISDKEVKKVISYINSEKKIKTEMDSSLVQELEKESEEFESPLVSVYEGDDPLFEEAKRVVIEAKKASASLLQRRLRIGYARAARLIDMLEEKGIVGPGEGAKPREVFGEANEKIEETNEDNNEGWRKV
jgi:S-DNA-T family DNA segregation ATPase FtsK/SpoIIIE